MKTNFTKRLLGACRLALMVVAMISTFGIVDATAQTCTVASNTTLDADCEATINVAAVAPDAMTFFSVTLNGISVMMAPAASVTVTMPGTYTYQVEDASGCWGTFNVEDKSGPVCEATDADLPTITVDCSNATPKAGFATLTAANFSDCSNDIASVYFVDEEVTGCDPVIVGTELGTPLDGAIDPMGNDICAIYKRSWFAIDGQGKVSAEGCAQFIVALRSADAPAITNIVSVECDDTDNLATLMAPKIASVVAGADSIALTSGTKICKYIATVNKGEELPTCGNGYKQINEWTVIDWCAGTIVAQETQLVIVEDTEAPTNVAKGTVSFAADPFDCSGKITVGAATADDNCSADALTWSTSITATAVDGHNGSSDVATTLATNGGTLANVGIGSTVTVTWTATDACGNMTASMDEVFTGTVDNRAPTAVCNDNLNVTLVATNDGPRARILAKDVDNGSTDNCGISSIQISRDGVTYADYLEVNCDDQPSLTVFLRVTDNAGTPNSNVCWSTITVEDKSVPVVTAPAATSVTCLEELPAVGTPTIVSQGCIAPTVSYDGQTGGDLACGVGSVTRAWTVTPPAGSGGHSSTTAPYKITQTISIIKADASWTANFPEDVLDIECTTANPIPAELTLAEILTDNACDDWLYDVQESTFSGTEGDECFKLVRTYTLINWCTVGDAGKPAIAITDREVDETTTGTDPVTGTTVTLQEYGKYSFSQLFKVSDSTVPDAAIALTPSCDIADDCNGGRIAVAVSDVSDNCSDATIISIDLSGNGISRSVTGAAADDGAVTFASLPAGTYGVTATVRDGCGNQRVVSAETTVVGDCKAPTPYGVAVFTALMESDAVDVWVSDIETKSSDNCTERDNLKFGIQLVTDTNGDNVLTESDVDGTTFPTTTSVTLTCDNIGVAAVALWVMDEAGNMQFVVIPVASSDNDNSCNRGGGDEAATVAGKIVDESDIEIDQVMVKFNGDKLSTFEQLFSGAFNYSVPMNSNVTITPEKNLGHSNGVNTADIVVLQRHLLGLAPLSSAYQLIAADVNNDNAVSTKDLLHISRLTIGVYDEFPNTTSWRFVDKSHTFDNPTSPWGFPEVINYADLSDDAQADFIGVKIGDLTGNAKPSQILGNEDVKVGAMTIAIDEAAVAAGTTQKIEFTAKNFNDFAGYQFSIELAEGVAFEGVEVGNLPNHTQANFGLNRLSEGVITTNWANAEALNLEDGEVLFTLAISSANSINVSEAINITSSVTAAEAYDNDLEVYDVDVQFNRTDAAFTLFQNAPNPFSNETIIGFNLPTAGVASLKVMDVSGRVIKAINGTYAAGFHQITLNKSDLGTAGVLYYQLDTDAHSATKKMVIVE